MDQDTMHIILVKKDLYCESLHLIYIFIKYNVMTGVYLKAEDIKS